MMKAKIWIIKLSLLSTSLLAFSVPLAGCDFSGSGNSGGSKVVWAHSLTLPDEIEVNATQAHIEGGFVYVAASGKLMCYDLRSGDSLWEVDLELGRTLAGRKILSDAERLFLNDTRWVKSFEKQSGRLLWEAPLDDFEAVNRATMAQDAEHLYLGGVGEVIRIHKGSGALDLRIRINQMQPEGVVQWAYDPAATMDGLLYVPTGYYVEGAPAINGNLLAYDAKTGAFVWGFRAEQ